MHLTLVITSFDAKGGDVTDRFDSNFHEGTDSGSRDVGSTDSKRMPFTTDVTIERSFEHHPIDVATQDFLLLFVLTEVRGEI